MRKVYNYKPDEYRVPLCAVTHIPAKEERRGGNIRISLYATYCSDKLSHDCAIYLFEVTKMSIHHPTNRFQKLKPLSRLNIRESSNLDA